MFRSFPFRAPSAPVANGIDAQVEEAQAPPPNGTLAREPEEAGEVIPVQVDPENVGEDASAQPPVRARAGGGGREERQGEGRREEGRGEERREKGRKGVGGRSLYGTGVVYSSTAAVQDYHGEDGSIFHAVRYSMTAVILA